MRSSFIRNTAVCFSTALCGFIMGLISFAFGTKYLLEALSEIPVHCTVNYRVIKRICECHQKGEISHVTVKKKEVKCSDLKLIVSECIPLHCKMILLTQNLKTFD